MTLSQEYCCLTSFQITGLLKSLASESRSEYSRESQITCMFCLYILTFLNAVTKPIFVVSRGCTAVESTIEESAGKTPVESAAANPRESVGRSPRESAAANLRESAAETARESPPATETESPAVKESADCKTGPCTDARESGKAMPDESAGCDAAGEDTESDAAGIAGALASPDWAAGGTAG